MVDASEKTTFVDGGPTESEATFFGELVDHFRTYHAAIGMATFVCHHESI